jgi:hypothetical protein
MKPHRPAALRVANRAGRLMRTSARHRFEPEELCEIAVQRTELDDFGPGDAWREGLQVLAAALERDARLTPVGRFFARGQLLAALGNRLRIEAEIATEPALLDRPIVAPILILGLPRTGSTLLQTLIALDRENRSLWHWEAAAPAPAPRSDFDPDDPRVTSARRAVKLIDYLAPDARRLHPVDAACPTECVTLFTNSFASLELACINWVPSYLDWCLSTDMAPHYAYYRRQLQLLQRHNSRDRWALKSPSHLFWVDQVVDMFPNVRLVQIHRDPADVLASYFDLVTVLSGIGSDHVDPRRVGPLWTTVWADALARADAMRRRTDLDVADVHYRDLVRDPVRAVHGIYERFDLPFSPDFDRRLREYVARDRYSSGRRPGSSLDAYGVSAADVRKAYADYCLTYDVTPGATS